MGQVMFKMISKSGSNAFTQQELTSTLTGFKELSVSLQAGIPIPSP